MLWIGQLLSDTGSGIGFLAYPLLILALTHSAALAGVWGRRSAGCFSDWAGLSGFLQPGRSRRRPGLPPAV